MAFAILAISPSEAQDQLAHVHDNRSGEIIIAGAICLSMAIAAVILRLIARRLSRARSMQLDDYVIINALVSLIICDERSLSFDPSWLLTCTACKAARDWRSHNTIHL